MIPCRKTTSKTICKSHFCNFSSSKLNFTNFLKDLSKFFFRSLHQCFLVIFFFLVFRLMKVFKKLATKYCPTFVYPAISMFDTFNPFLQAEVSLNHSLHLITAKLLHALLTRFFLLERISQSYY